MTFFEDSRAEAKARLSVVEEQIRDLEKERRELEGMLNALRDARGNGGPEDEPRRRIPIEKRREQVLRIVRGSPGIRVGSLASALGITHARVVQVVNGLEKDGLVQRLDGGGIAGSTDPG